MSTFFEMEYEAMDQEIYLEKRNKKYLVPMECSRKFYFIKLENPEAVELDHSIMVYSSTNRMKLSCLIKNDNGIKDGLSPKKRNLFLVFMILKCCHLFHHNMHIMSEQDS